MRLWTIPLLGAVALSLTVADPASARPRFGPGAMLGAFAGLFGGFRHAQRHHRRVATARARPGDAARAGDTARAGDISPIERPYAAGQRAGWAGPVFWPHAADDLIGYAFFPNGAGGRFWAYGDILNGVFIDRASLRGARVLPAAEPIAAAPETDDRPTALQRALCASVGGTSGADGVVEWIEQAVAPSEAQRELLARLGSAMEQASERIAAVCPSGLPANPLQRLDTMQDRIWAMLDAALTIRVPLENFYASLSEEQKSRLSWSDADQSAMQTAGERALPKCGEGMRGVDASLALERLIKPTREQRASLQAL